MTWFDDMFTIRCLSMWSQCQFAQDISITEAFNEAKDHQLQPAVNVLRWFLVILGQYVHVFASFPLGWSCDFQKISRNSRIWVPFQPQDNVKYLTTLEKFIEPLYSGTPRPGHARPCFGSWRPRISTVAPWLKSSPKLGVWKNSSLYLVKGIFHCHGPAWRVY